MEKGVPICLPTSWQHQLLIHDRTKKEGQMMVNDSICFMADYHQHIR
jgi:hypothetical protein